MHTGLKAAPANYLAIRGAIRAVTGSSCVHKWGSETRGHCRMVVRISPRERYFRSNQGRVLPDGSLMRTAGRTGVVCDIISGLMSHGPVTTRFICRRPCAVCRARRPDVARKIEVGPSRRMPTRDCLPLRTWIYSRPHMVSPHACATPGRSVGANAEPVRAQALDADLRPKGQRDSSPSWEQ